MDMLSTGPFDGRLPSDPPDLDPAVRAFRLVLAAGHRLRSVMDDHLRPAGLTTQQAAVMSVVEAAGTASLGDVAAALGTSHQNLRQIADALVRKGFVQIAADPHDGRRRILSLTSAATRFWGERSQGDAAVVEACFESLSRRERLQLVDLLTRVVAHEAG